MEVRILRYEDADAIKELIETRDRMLGISNPDQLQMMREQGHLNTLNLLRHSDLEHQMGRIFGCFENGVLVGVLYTVTSTEQPCWYMTRAHTRKGVTNGPSILGSLTREAVSLYEAAGFRRFYTMYPKRYIAAYQPLWKTSDSLHGYHSYTDLEVPPLTKPKFNDFWELLLGRALYTNTMVIRGFIKVFGVDTIQRN